MRNHEMRAPVDRAQFPATSWTIVRQLDDPSSAHDAFARLCASYWYPIYAFARRSGWSPEDAEDATQSFFAGFVEKNLFAAADPHIGKLRTYLLTAFSRHLHGIREHDGALKRGGGCEFLPLAAFEGEALYAREPTGPATPEQLFDRAWAVALIRATLRILGEEEADESRGTHYSALEPFLSPDASGTASYADAAAQMGISETAARQAVSRLRGRFRDVLNRQIAATLREPTHALIAEEIMAIRAALSPNAALW